MGKDNITCKKFLSSTNRTIRAITKEINTTFNPSSITCIAFIFITLLFNCLLKCIIYIYFIGLSKRDTALCIFNRCKSYIISVPIGSINTRCTCFCFPYKIALLFEGWRTPACQLSIYTPYSLYLQI